MENPTEEERRRRVFEHVNFYRSALACKLESLIGDGAKLTTLNGLYDDPCPHCDHKHVAYYCFDPTVEGFAFVDECINCGAAWTAGEMAEEKQ
jgi:hypothetical protein